MKIALIGATGFVGGKLRDEALSRGHAVTAFVRDTAKLPTHAALDAQAIDATDQAALAAALAGHDVVLSAFSPAIDDPDVETRYVAGARTIVAAVKASGVARFVAIGGAGSLFVAPGVQLVDTPEFPDVWRKGARGARQLLRDLQAETTLDWAFVSPPPLLRPGTRTGRYTIGGDDVPLRDGKPAAISVDDLAVAVIDEIETPRHHRQRFSVF